MAQPEHVIAGRNRGHGDGSIGAHVGVAASVIHAHEVAIYVQVEAGRCGRHLDGPRCRGRWRRGDDVREITESTVFFRTYPVPVGRATTEPSVTVADSVRVQVGHNAVWPALAGGALRLVAVLHSGVVHPREVDGTLVHCGRGQAGRRGWR